MTDWKPVIVGVDDSSSSAAAVVMGWKIATAAGTDCYLVYGTQEVSSIPVSPPGPLRLDRERLGERLTGLARRKLEIALRGNVPAGALEHLEVRLGKGAWAVAQAIREHDASLLVLGGKHHAPPVRWFGGSTAHHAVRTIDTPILISWAERRTIRRVLAAVDLSYATAPTLRAALRFVQLFDAQVRVLHVLEPLPFMDELPIHLEMREYERHSEEELERVVTRVAGGSVERVLRRDQAPFRAIAEESAAYDADLVVLGSHGKGWVDRVLIGSTTERLINRLPTSLLVVPVRATEQESTVLALSGDATQRAAIE